MPGKDAQSAQSAANDGVFEHSRSRVPFTVEPLQLTPSPFRTAQPPAISLQIGLHVPSVPHVWSVGHVDGHWTNPPQPSDVFPQIPAMQTSATVFGLHGVPEHALLLQYIASPQVPQSGISPPHLSRIEPHVALADVHVRGTQASRGCEGDASVKGEASAADGVGLGDELTSSPHP